MLEIGLVRLTPKETQALLLYASGYTGQEAADEMGWTNRSAFWGTIADIKHKLGAKTNPHIISLAYHHGILVTPYNNGKQTVSH